MEIVAATFAANIDVFPLWSLLPLTMGLVIVVLELGYRVGQWRHKRNLQEKESPVGGMVNAMVGLLAFILAFTFGMAGSRYENRRETFLKEVNGIGTAYLRANLLEEPYRGKVRQLLREYVALRVDLTREKAKVEDALKRSEEIHSRLWDEAVLAGRKEPNSIVVGLFIQALNEMIDLHTSRVNVGLRSRIPDVLWVVLYAITLISMGAMGYHAGLTDTSRSVAALALTFCFSLILYLIADLDRPLEGTIRVNQTAMAELRASMTEP